MARAKLLARPGLIPETALSIIADEGIARFSTRKLAAELKISPMTIYNYYENRETVLKGALAFGMKRFALEQARIIRENLPSWRSPLDYFHMLPQILVEFAARQPRLFEFLFGYDSLTFVPDQDMVREYHREVSAAIPDEAGGMKKLLMQEHIYLYEVLIHVLVIKRLRKPDMFGEDDFARLSAEAYNRLIKPDEIYFSPSSP